MFDALIPITKPTMPSYTSLEQDMKALFENGMITNGKYVKDLETRLETFLKVENAIGLSSCTGGLMLAWKAVGARTGGEVILPSFTFSATGHALLWNGLIPRFVDIEPETMVLDLNQVELAINSDTVGICGLHAFGNPAYPDRLEQIASKHGLPLVFDSAHALGSSYQGRPIGSFGDVELFSMSPTKLVTAGEGGLATTNNPELARLFRIGRDYGNPGDYDCEFAGINARMSEFHALLARESLAMLDSNIVAREALNNRYKAQLSQIEGIGFQSTVEGGRSTHKDFAILINPSEFGMDRDQLSNALQSENIMTRKYFFPLLHLQKAFSAFREDSFTDLHVSEQIASQVLCLPMFSHMSEAEVDNVCSAIKRIQDQSESVKKVIAARI